MAEDKTMLLVLALVAMVAIVAAFGIVNMTGFATMQVREKISGVCNLYNENCMTPMCIDIACSQNQCSVPIPGLGAKCNQCVAWKFACDIQNGGFIKQVLIDNMQNCMSKCTDTVTECFAGTGCTSLPCCTGYTGYGCLNTACEAVSEHFCQADCAIPGTLPGEPT